VKSRSLGWLALVLGSMLLAYFLVSRYSTGVVDKGPSEMKWDQMVSLVGSVVGILAGLKYLIRGDRKSK
jgi:hypothetical protein